jgi:hypothetical protein
MQPNERLFKALRHMYPEQEVVRVKRALDDLMTVDGLSRLLENSLVACSKGNGQLDLREVAAHMLRVLMENQR